MEADSRIVPTHWRTRFFRVEIKSSRMNARPIVSMESAMDGQEAIERVCRRESIPTPVSDSMTIASAAETI